MIAHNPILNNTYLELNIYTTFHFVVIRMNAKYEYLEWHFIEIANDIRDIKNQLINKIREINL